ncbi:hypothetical protein A1Q1_01112 [Trichosporon asahii var. asahii CBS 2479]|uniref:NAD-dependent epimerase/dehydratase domain-containing protein n=1 Tax=Trichosporon asahii var. asahii (strain ATCC 90039 / CBS 2479 / JCM 2466 / KCTC 7840 / NBRC 103889/ NCYC 2677 / UAMH 7654) TaxID=1186058 RepID=J5T8N8_TRIAS|nr:hypothetical protein A1Q1_01112 [Trichosporon asahii var. asahii CBS 2479]EJT49756.1 hypothetical protein A1Q1_01112 [Trichosporon asahii var. asahii CBS 2479]
MTLTPVLVTGASGYIASWITLYLLEAGYRVRGTTRNAAKGQWMQDMYASRGLKDFEYVIVSDLENANAFDEAVKDVDAIMHTASPFHWNVTKPDDFIKPAVAGTESVLRAASKEPRVQRLVITSSYASILENRDPGTATFTEDDWNQQSIDAVEKEGTEAWRMHWYRASKTLAERAAWKYVEENKPSWDLVTVCPPTSREVALTTAVANWYSYLTGEKTAEDAIAPAGILCDVRDVARVHVKAMMLPEAGGQRFGIATLHEHPELIAEFPKTVKGQPGAPVPTINWFDCSRSLKTLDMTPTSEVSTAVDMTKSLAERKAGWAEAKAMKA